MAKRLTREQILQIPDLVKEKGIEEIATQFQCSSRAIDYQIKKLRKAGIEVVIPLGRRPLKLK